MSRKAIKKYIRFVHRWLGLISGSLVVFVALTGSLLAFEDDGRDFLLHEDYHIANPRGERLSLDRLVDTFRVYNPKIKINSIRFKERADAAYVFFTKDKYVFMDPYTARITATVPMNREFFTVVRLLHTSLLLGEVGKTIVHINVLIFFLICLSGLVLWWPRKWKFFRSSVTVNLRSGNGKRINYDWHRAMGFYVLPVLLIISFTGLFMASDITKNLVSWVVRAPIPEDSVAIAVAKPAAGGRQHYSLDSAYAYVRVRYPGAQETFVTPGTKEAPIRVIMRYPFIIARRQNTLYFNPSDGALLKTDLYTNYNAYDKVARSNYNLHTGKYGPLGIFSKILYSLVALITASLPITGFCIWMGKRKKRGRGGSLFY